MLGAGERVDQGFVDWLKNRPHPVVDMCEFYKSEFSHPTFDVDSFLREHYIGHHMPVGNSFSS